MATKQGKVKAIPVTDLKQNAWIIINNQIYVVMDDGEDAGGWIGLKVYNSKPGRGWIEGYRNDFKFSITTLVVEYIDGFDFDGKYDNPVMKQLPLKHKQWQAAIDNGEVDSDKVVEFEITTRTCHHQCFGTQISRGICECAKTQYAKIIPKREPRLYTEGDVKNECIAFANWIANTVIAGRPIEKLWRDYKTYQNTISSSLNP